MRLTFSAPTAKGSILSSSTFLVVGYSYYKTVLGIHIGTRYAHLIRREAHKATLLIFHSRTPTNSYSEETLFSLWNNATYYKGAYTISHIFKYSLNMAYLSHQAETHHGTYNTTSL